MATELFLEQVPASLYDLTTCTVEQLDLVETQATDLIDRIRDTKKGATLIASLNTRYRNRQFVRCTEQSVKTTAAARYDPGKRDLDISGFTIACFVGLVTYLPLPAIKTLSANASATKRAEQIWASNPLDSRWAIYYERLVSVNSTWASLFLKEVQSHMEGPMTAHFNTAPIQHVLQQESRVPNNVIASNEILIHSENIHAPHQSRTEPLSQSPLQNESLLLKVIKAKTSAWGPEHPTTIASVVDLVALYFTQMRLMEAKMLLLQTFQIWKKAQADRTPESHSLLALLAEVECQMSSDQTGFS